MLRKLQSEVFVESLRECNPPYIACSGIFQNEHKQYVHGCGANPRIQDTSSKFAQPQRVIKFPVVVPDEKWR